MAENLHASFIILLRYMYIVHTLFYLLSKPTYNLNSNFLVAGALAYCSVQRQVAAAVNQCESI